MWSSLNTLIQVVREDDTEVSLERNLNMESVGAIQQRILQRQGGHDEVSNHFMET